MTRWREKKGTKSMAGDNLETGEEREILSKREHKVHKVFLYWQNSVHKFGGHYGIMVSPLF